MKLLNEIQITDKKRIEKLKKGNGECGRARDGATKRKDERAYDKEERNKKSLECDMNTK